MREFFIIPIIFLHFYSADASPKKIAACLNGFQVIELEVHNLLKLGFQPTTKPNFVTYNNLLVEVGADGKKSFFYEDVVMAEEPSLHYASVGTLTRGVVIKNETPTFYNQIQLDENYQPAIDAMESVGIKDVTLLEQFINAGFIRDGNFLRFEHPHKKGFNYIVELEGDKIKKIYRDIWPSDIEWEDDFDITKIIPQSNGTEIGVSDYAYVGIKDETKDIVVSIGLRGQAKIISYAHKKPLPTSSAELEKLGYKHNFPKMIMGENSDFRIGGVNTNDEIGKVQSFNGIPLDELEKRLNPMGFSDAGFKGRDEKLIDILIKDNDYVVNQMGLTHQKIAETLMTPILLFSDIKKKYFLDEVTFEWHGRKFKIKGDFSRGSQGSPFRDGTSGEGSFTVTNLETGKSVSYADLVPEMIYRYGFYEGEEVPWRVDPEDIVGVFDFLVE